MTLIFTIIGCSVALIISAVCISWCKRRSKTPRTPSYSINYKNLDPNGLTDEIKEDRHT